MEAVRQPAAQPHACGAGRPVPGRVGGAVARLGVDARRRGLPGGSRPDRVAAGPRAKAGRCGARPASRGERALARAPAGAGAADARLSSVRGVLQPGRHRAHGRAPARHAPTAPGVDAIGRSRAPGRAESGRRVGEDVDRPVARGRHRRLSVDGPASGSRRCRADPAALVRRADRHLADQPSAVAACRAADGPPAPLPERRRPQDLGLLRHLCRSRRSLAAAGQLPGGARHRRGASHVADQHGAGAARQPLGLRLRLHLGRPAPGSHRAGVPGDVRDGAPSRPFLQLVRHAVARPARAALHLVGGQRQPGRPPADAAPGLLALAGEPILPARALPGPSGHIRPRRRQHPGRADDRHDAAAEDDRRGVRVAADDRRRGPAGARTPRRGERRAGRRARDDHRP